MDNNKAFKAVLGNITKIEGADRIVSASVILDGVPITQVVVGVDTVEGIPIVYFDSNMCLSDTFLADYPELKTYLAKGSRVRCVKLKGIISNGLAVEEGKFLKYTKDVPNSFTSLGSVEICKKWVPEVVQQASRNSKMGKAKKPSRVIPEVFHFHIDTQQLARNIHKVNPNDIISISRKIHGTSAICGYLPVKKSLTFIEKLAKKLGVSIQNTVYDYLYAPRTVIKNATDGDFTDLWSTVGKTLFVGKLNKGETVYYEIVGYIPGASTFIQKNYDYGCKPGDYKVAVYRITQTNEDGIVFEYSWAAMKERCKELNVPMVQEYYFGKASDLFDFDTGEGWHNLFLLTLKREYLEKDSSDNLCKKVPDEEVVLRIEAKDITVFKLKSERFFLNESASKDAGEADIEEQEAVAE